MVDLFHLEACARLPCGGIVSRHDDREPHADRVWELMATLYDKLGVEPKASAEEITRAYRRLAMKYHPDRHPAGGKAAAQSAFYEIGTAFETLSDGERRAQYDEKLRLAEKLKEASRQQDQHRTFYEGWVKLAVSLTASGQDRASVCKALLAQGCPQKNAEHIAQMAMIRRAHFSRGKPRPRSKRFWRMPRLKHKGAPVEAADKAALIRRRLQRYGIAGASVALLLAVGIASTMVGEDDAADVAAPVHALAPHRAPGPTRTAQATDRPADPGTAALLDASGTNPSRNAPETVAGASEGNGTDGGIDALVDDLADASAAPAMAANASAAAAAAAEADAQVSPIQSQIAHFDQATGTGTMTYAQLPAGPEFAPFRTQLQAPFTIRLLTTRLLGANPRRVLYLFASTSADKAQGDCDHCKALISAMVTQQVDKNSEAVVTPLEVLAAMGAHGGYDARANRPAIVEVGPGKQGLILKDVTNRNGAIRESAVFFALEPDRIARLGTLVTRIDMTDTAECAAHHSPRVPVDMMCPNWSASYFFVRDRKDSMYPLSAHALGTEWLVPSHTPFPVDEQHVVVPDGHGHFVETAEHHDGATPTVAAELLGKPRVATAPPRRVVNSASGARAHTGHTPQAASRGHGAGPGPASRTTQTARQKSHGTVLPPLTASARRQPVLFNADADAAY